MKKATIEERLQTLRNAGRLLRSYLKGEDVELWNAVIQRAFAENGWFSADQVDFALRVWAGNLEDKKISHWAGSYELKPQSTKLCGMVMAGNIPMAGLHDLFCCILAGVPVMAKLSSQDKVLLPFLFDLLSKEQPWLKDFVRFTSGTLRDCNLYIATGSASTARHFQEFFGKYPSIIRKHRNSVAILNGRESDEELKGLGEDIFTYYGLGCRSVSKIFVPEGYDPDTLFKGLFSFANVLSNNKYANNFDYYRAIYLLNKEEVLENGFLLYLRKDGYASPPATLFWEAYHDAAKMMDGLENDRHLLQCVTSSNGWVRKSVPFGRAQKPELTEYADQIDTVQFLLENTAGNG